MEESIEVQEYKKARETIKTLENHPKVLEWIEIEGRRKVEEYVAKQVINLKNEHPILTDEDINWILNDNGNELLLVWDDNNENVIEIVRVEKKNRYKLNKCGSSISKLDLLPHEMNHLWGQGYKCLI